MAKEQCCSLCKVKFIEALWCPLAGGQNCPVTDQRQPTQEQRELLKMDEERA